MGKLTKPNHTPVHVGIKSSIMKSDLLPKSKPNRKFQLALMGLSQPAKQKQPKRPESRSSPTTRTHSSNNSSKVNSSINHSDRHFEESIQFTSRCHLTSTPQQISFTRSSPRPSPPETPGKTANDVSDSTHRPYKASPLSQLNDQSPLPISFVRSKLHPDLVTALPPPATFELQERVTPVSKVKSGICMRSISRLNDQIGKSLSQSLHKLDPLPTPKDPIRCSPVVLKETSVSRSSSSVSESVTPHSIVSPVKSSVPSIVTDILKGQLLPLHPLSSVDKPVKQSSSDQVDIKKCPPTSRVNTTSTNTATNSVINSATNDKSAGPPQQPVSVFLRLGKGKRAHSRSQSPDNLSDYKRSKPAVTSSKRNSISKGSHPAAGKLNRFDSFESWDNFKSHKLFPSYPDLPISKFQHGYESSGFSSSSSSFDSRFPSPGYGSQSQVSAPSQAQPQGQSQANFGGLFPPMFNGYPLVRCAYFPHCSRPDCTFFHPEEECHYGDACPYFKECVYVHPSELVPTMCKYDDTCTRTDCFYHHVKRRHTVGKPEAFIPINCLTDGCLEPSCPYVHSGQKLPFAKDYCIFQARCNRPPCLRVHISDFRYKPPRKVLYVEEVTRAYLDLFSPSQALPASSPRAP